MCLARVTMWVCWQEDGHMLAVAENVAGVGLGPPGKVPRQVHVLRSLAFICLQKGLF